MLPPSSAAAKMLLQYLSRPFKKLSEINQAVVTLPVDSKLGTRVMDRCQVDCEFTM